MSDRVAMTDDGWTSTVAFDDLVDGKGVRVTVDDVDVLLVRSGEQLYAIGSRCTHQGAPLERGPLRLTGSDPTVTCPAHGSVFRLQDGKVAQRARRTTGAVVRCPCQPTASSSSVPRPEGYFLRFGTQQARACGR